MSPNSNYLAGRRFEYERMKHWRNQKHDVMRTAGSHGLFDIVTIAPSGDVQLIQCKRCDNEASALRLVRNFKDRPPLGHRTHAKYHQGIEIRVKGDKEVISAWI